MQTAKRLATRFPRAGRAAALIVEKGIGCCTGGMADHFREEFQRRDDFERSPRVAKHSRDGVTELMPIAEQHLYSFTRVSGHHGNFRLGLSTVMSFGVLVDIDTGIPILVSEPSVNGEISLSPDMPKPKNLFGFMPQRDTPATVSTMPARAARAAPNQPAASCTR